MYAFRGYSSADFKALWQLDQSCFPAGIAYSQRELSHYLADPRAWVEVATAGSPPQLAGFILCFIVAGKHGHIITIDVAPPEQRSGLGTLLMERAEKAMRARECSSIKLEVAVDNHAALRFYRKAGFRVVRTLPQYYPNGVDGLRMTRELAPAAPAATRPQPRNALK